MKRLLCLLLAACMMLSLCACEKGREKERQFFHFRQRICTNITIKSMQKQIIRPVLFV